MGVALREGARKSRPVGVALYEGAWESRPAHVKKSIQNQLSSTFNSSFRTEKVLISEHFKVLFPTF